MDAARSELVWNLVGRGPAFATLVLLTAWAARRMGTVQAVLGLGGFCAGAIVGTSVLPSILGALGGGVAGAVATWRATRAPLPGPGPFVVALLGLIALGRVGCLVSGCCFGRPDGSLFAVHYGVGSLAQGLHLELGLVGRGEAPLGVFPVQAVESLGLVALLGLGAALRRRVRSEGAWALGLASGYLVLRAAVDPLRAMVNTPSSAHALGPLSHFQWAALTAALAGLVVAVVLSRRAQRVPSSGLREVSPRLGWTVWLAQVVAALACHGEGTWMLRVLAVASLAAGAVVLAWSAEPVRRGLRWGLVTAGVVLLTPLVPRAADGAAARPELGWIYAPNPLTGQLVRLGPGATSQAELLRRYAALLEQPATTPGTGGPAAPPPPPLVPLEESPPAPSLVPQAPVEAPGAGVHPGADAPSVPSAPASGTAPGAAPPRTRPGHSTLIVQAAGGVQAYQFSTCGGVTTGMMTFGAVGGAFEERRANGDHYQLRARLLAGTDGSGAAAMGGGLYEWTAQRASFGLGLDVGGSRTRDLRPFGFGFLSPFSNAAGAPELLVMPLVYVRLLVLEFGTGSRFQPTSGPFMGLRFGDEDDPFGLRVGFELAWLPFPLANMNVYLGGRVALPSHEDSVELRGTFGSGSSTQRSVSFGLRYEHRFE